AEADRRRAAGGSDEVVDRIGRFGGAAEGDDADLGLVRAADDRSQDFRFAAREGARIFDQAARVIDAKATQRAFGEIEIEDQRSRMGSGQALFPALGRRGDGAEAGGSGQRFEGGSGAPGYQQEGDKGER